jgi:phospholipid/cholesterol/gamma-HCH transport system substrate-binding protein
MRPSAASKAVMAWPSPPAWTTIQSPNASLAGIKVGSVTRLDLDRESYQARAEFAVESGLAIPEDSDVKIASEGLLGGSFVEITPGASEFVLEPGDEFVNVQSSVSLLNLLMRFGTGE